MFSIILLAHFLFKKKYSKFKFLYQVACFLSVDFCIRIWKPLWRMFEKTLTNSLLLKTNKEYLIVLEGVSLIPSTKIVFIINPQGLEVDEEQVNQQT